MINRGRYALFAQGHTQYSARAVDLVRRSTVVDMLGLLTLNYRKLSAWAAQTAPFSDADFVRLRESGITVFHPAVGFVDGDIHAQTLRDVSAWNSFIAARAGQFQRVDSIADFREAKTLGRIGILIGQQNSAHFRTVDDVDSFYRLGQRVSQLTYRGTKIGGGSSDARDTGLSPYGIQIVERMNAVGMAVDISHCGDRTTLNAIEASRKPVLVTHSNCRALVPGSSRCKTDEAIRRMAAKGGVMGFTMVRAFVRSSGPVTIEHVLDHVDHLVKVAGVEHAGIGSDVDLDGRDLLLKPEHRFDLDDIDYSRKIYDLTEGLLRRKYSNQNIELILGGNFERALTAAWTV
jgi:membrane dipeptidase